MKTYLRRFIGLVAMVLFAALPATAQDTAPADDSDKGYLTRLLQDSLGGEGRTVSINGFKGAFSSTATMDSITVADPKGVWLSLTDVQMTWTRSALLRGRVEVNDLSARQITLSRLPEPAGTDLPAPEASGFSLPDLPVSVRIELIKAEKIVLGQPVLGEAAEMALTGALRLEDGEAEASFNATRLDGKTGRVALAASYAEADQALSIDLDVSEQEGGLTSLVLNLPERPSVDLTVKGTGTLDDFDAQMRLATAGAERLAGHVRIAAVDPVADGQATARRFTARMGGDVTALFAPEYRSFFGEDIQLSVQGERAATGALAVDELSLDTRALTLAGSVRLNADLWPEAMDIKARIASGDGQAVLLPLSGPQTRIGTLDMTLEYDHADGDGFDGRLELAGIRRDGLRIDRALVTSTGTLQGDVGGVGQVAARTEFQVSGIGLPDPALAQAVGDALSGGFNLTFAPNQPLTLGDLRVTADGITLTGKAAASDLQSALRTSFETALDVDDLSRLAAVAGQDLSGSADVSLSGTADLGGVFDITMRGSATDLGIGQDQADALLAGTTALTVKARRDTTGTYLDQLDLGNPQISLKADGRLATDDSDMRLEARIEDASVLSPELTGPLTLNGTAAQRAEGLSVNLDASGPFGATASVKGRVTGTAPRVTFGASLPDISALAPQLSGPAVIDGTLTGDGTVWTVDAKASGPEGLTATLNGPVAGTPIRLEFDAALPDMSSFVPQLSGAASLRGVLAQQGQIWSVDATANGPEGMSAQVTGPVLGAPIRLEFSAGLPQISAFVPQLSGPVRADGTLQQDGDAFLIDATGSGPFGMSAQVSGPVAGAPLRLAFTAALPDVSPFAPQFRGAARAEGTLAQDGGILRLDASATGPYGLTAQVAGPLAGAPLAMEFSARLPDVGPLVPQISGPLSATGRIAQENGGWRLSVNADGPQGTRAQASGMIAGDGTLQLSSSGSAPLGLADPFLRPRSVRGMASFDLTVNGPPALGSVAGRITTSGASFSAPAFKVLINDIDAAVTLNGGRAQVELSGIFSDGGRLSIRGPITLSGAYPADLSIIANARLVDPRLYDATLDANIAIDGPLRGGAMISGRVNIGETVIHVPSSGLSGGGPIPEIRHVGAPARVQATRERAGLVKDDTSGGAGGGSGPVYGLDIRINAPARIFVRGRGLDAEIGGSFRLTGDTRNTFSSGSLELIRGRLDILQKRFVLDEGSVQLQGDFNPFVRFVASTKTDIGTASVVIEGPASEPQVRFESSPQAPEEEVLSQIFFGRDLTQISAFQALQLANAVATLAGRGGEGVVSKLRRGFGFDDLDLTTNENGDAELRVGKYISDNVYTDVTVGPESSTDLSINLDLSPSLTAKGTVGSNDNSSIGVFFEKDY